MPKDFEKEDLVWAKMKGFPYWPGKIIEPPAEAKAPKHKKSQHYIYFFGSNNYAWILDENIIPHDDSLVQSNKIKSAVFQKAVETIVNESKSVKKEKNVVHKILKESKENADKDSSQNKTPNSVKKPKKSEKKADKSISAKKVDVPVQGKATKKRPSSIIDTDNGGPESSVSYPKSERVENDYLDLLASAPPNMGCAHILPCDSYHQSPGISSKPEYIERPQSPALNLSVLTETLKNKGVVPCSKKIGFLGLGTMGQGIVKNLLNSGHHVTIWNRNPRKMEIFLAAGAFKGMTPADVVQECDITFCCVSDPDAVNNVVFGNWGVLKGLDLCSGRNKGYVELSSIDPETSQSVSVEITLKGGRYLEAPIAGTQKEAIEGALYILAAGDHSLFMECESCFNAIAKDAYYISSEVGKGAKMNLVHNMLHGTVYAAMAEAMALVDRCKLSQTDFLEIFKLGTLNCQAMIDKGTAIQQRSYSPNTSLKHLQKDLNLAMLLSASADQPLQAAAAANEVYKHAKQLHYGNHGVRSVYQGTG